MKKNLSLPVVLIGLGLLVSAVPVNAAPPALTASPTPMPIVHFWFFFDSGCYGCLKVYNSVLPRIMAAHQPEQITMRVQDLARGDSSVKRALEQQYGVVKGDNTVIFIGEYALLGSQEIETRLPQLIDQYLAQGGVALVEPTAVAQPTATFPPTRSSPLSPTRSQTMSAQTSVVRAILFWSKTCPHCHEVINNVLPPLQDKYGNRLDIRLFELSDPANRPLFEAALEAFCVPLERSGVPLLVIGDTVLVGSDEIPQQLPALIEQQLAAGGIGWPRIPGLEGVVETQGSMTPTATVTYQSPTPVVRAVMYWMNGCPHCDQVLTNVLPPLEQKYGDQLEIRLVEVATPQDIDNLYTIAATYGFSKEQTGVPFLLIGNQALVGSEQIPAELPGLIDRLLAAGGTDWPDIAGLNPVTLPQTSNPICAPTTTDWFFGNLRDAHYM